MLGTDLVEELKRRGHEVDPRGSAELDVTDPASVDKIRKVPNLDYVFNASAYTAVDKAEQEEDRAAAVNGDGPGRLAAAARDAGARLIHVSTDFVFDGEGSEPYTEDHPTHPLGAYGRGKRMGEENALREQPEALVVRTAWLYGPNGASFPKTMIRAFVAGKTLRVVADQRGNPTYTADLARVLADLAERNAPGGVYHAAGPDTMSWYDFARLAIETYVQGERPVEIAPIRTEDWPTPAKRPAYSALSFAKVAALGVAPMRPTAEALAEFVARLGPVAV